MEQIARFRLKNDFDWDSLKYSAPASWIHKEAIKCIHYHLADSITLNIGFPEDLSKWDDYNYILVLDEDFGQPYTPFYSYWLHDVQKPFPFLFKVVSKYNQIMRSLPYLEEIK